MDNKGRLSVSHKQSKQLVISLRRMFSLFVIHFLTTVLLGKRLLSSSFFVYSFSAVNLFFFFSAQLLIVCTDDSTRGASSPSKPCSNCRPPNVVDTESEQDFNFWSKITQNNSSYITTLKRTYSSVAGTMLRRLVRSYRSQCGSRTDTLCLFLVIYLHFPRKDNGVRLYCTQMWLQPL